MPHKKPPKEHRFTSENQPTPEQREKAKRTRKLNYRLKPYIGRYRNMPIEQFLKLQKDVKKNPKKYTVNDLIAIKAVSNMMKDFRYYKDERDRNEGVPIQKQEITADVKQDIDSNNINTNVNMEYSDEKSATILSILAKQGAIKPGTEKDSKAKTESVDTDNTDS